MHTTENTRDEEEVLFKIKNMKESLMSDKNKTSSNLYGRLNSEKERTQKFYKDHGQEHQKNIMVREENIDKINSKIKNILNCLQESEKYQENKLNIRQKNYEKPESKNRTTAASYCMPKRDESER